MFRVLVIEDGQGDALLLLRAVRAAIADADVTILPDGSALRAALDDLARPDLVLCDWVHPDNGDRSLELLRARWPDVGIVVLTASDAHAIARAQELGANEAHVKAFGLREFVDQVAGILARWVARGERG